MRVRAKASAALPHPGRSGTRFSPREAYFVTPGHTYEVAGVGVFEEELCVLINDDDRHPDWPPAALFEVIDSTVPGHWIARLFDAEDTDGGGWTFRLGYPELVNSLAHVNGVIEGDSAATEVHYIEAGTITPPQT